MCGRFRLSVCLTVCIVVVSSTASIAQPSQRWRPWKPWTPSALDDSPPPPTASASALHPVLRWVISNVGWELLKRASDPIPPAQPESGWCRGTEPGDELCQRGEPMAVIRPGIVSGQTTPQSSYSLARPEAQPSGALLETMAPMPSASGAVPPLSPPLLTCQNEHAVTISSLCLPNQLHSFLTPLGSERSGALAPAAQTSPAARAALLTCRNDQAIAVGSVCVDR